MALLLIFLSLHCAPPKPGTAPADTAPAVEPVDYGPVLTPRPLDLVAARGETLGFAVRIRNAPDNTGLRLRVLSPQSSTLSPSPAFYRLIRIPAPTPDPDFIRHTGLPADRRELPPALLPLGPNKKGVAAVNSDDLIWVDLPIPTDAPAGDYDATIDLARDANGHPIASTPITLHVHDFVLPAEKHLHLTGDLDWNTLAATYPGAFTDLTQPWLLTRQNDRGTQLLERLDELMQLARANRVALQFPRLQPVVKLPPGQPPVIEWADYDSVVTPWLADRDYLELPRFDAYDRLDPATRAAYWREVIGHFDRNDWLPRAALTPTDPQTLNALLSPQSSVLSPAGPRILTESQRTDADPHLLPHAPLLVSDITRPVSAPNTWLSPSSLVLTTESDVRTLAFLAAVRNATVLRFGPAFATSTALPATQTPWFYPGTYFGQDHPLESLALKWARRAQQDYEYLYLAQQRGQRTTAALLATLTARPMATAGDPVDWPITRMLAGTVNPDAFHEVIRLLARTIESTEPGGQSPEAAERLQLDQARWLDPQSRTMLAATETLWTRTGDTLNLDLRALVAQPGPSHNTPGSLALADTVPPHWHPGPPTAIPPFSVRATRERTTAAVDLTALPTDPTRHPLDLQFVDGFTRRPSIARVVLPVADVPYRPTAAITTDGALGDWSREDLLHTGPLTAFLARPAAQSGDAPEALPVDLFAAHDDRDLHFAFRIPDLPPNPQRVVKNSVDYKDDRAWGEHLCQFLLQPVYADNTPGPLIHVVVKPSAQWIELREQDGTWRPAPETDVTYAATMTDDTWSGELQVPLKSLQSPAHGPIAVLRFNFARHDPLTARSASYAGPIDTFRDSPLTAALILRR